MEQPCVLCEGEQNAEAQQSTKEAKEVDDDDAELIFVGVEHVNEDAELIFVGVTSSSKPVVSTILNRVTPGSRARRRKYGCHRKNTNRLQSTSDGTPTSEKVTVETASPSESRSTDSPVIIIEPLSKPDDKNNSPQVVPTSSSELCSPLITCPSSLHHPGVAALTIGNISESTSSKRCATSDANGINSKRCKLNDGTTGGYSSTLSPSGIFQTVSAQQSTPLNNVHTSLSHLQNEAPSPTAFPKDNSHFQPLKISPERENKLAKTGFPSPESQNKASDPPKGTLVLSLSDLYYGQHDGDGQLEPKTHTTFKCSSCLKVLKNTKFMNHMKHHLELERQRVDSWENHTTCQHCHRKFPTPFQLQRHIENVHTTQEPSAVCKICEFAFETDQVLLQHMKDNHKPGEMPYVCQVCSFRSAVFADVEMHFRTRHENTKNLLCPFCLKIFKTASPYMCHYRRHWESMVHQCSKCRLQFLTFKDKMEHKTQCHQMFKMPKQLEGLPPETKVVMQVSLGPVQPGLVEVASIALSTIDPEPSLPKSKSKISKKPH